MSETDIIEDINCMSLVPDEIVVKIFSYVPIQWLLGCVTQVSKRFHQLSQNESLWVKFNASEKTLPVQFLGYILQRGTKYLSLFETNLDGDDPHLFPKQNKLKYLNLFNCTAKTEKHLIQANLFQRHSFLHQLHKPQYDKRLFIDLRVLVQYMKMASSEYAQNMLRTSCVHELFLKKQFVFSACS